MTVIQFDNLASVRVFAGEAYEMAVVPPEARELLLEFDDLAQHYQIKVSL